MVPTSPADGPVEAGATPNKRGPAPSLSWAELLLRVFGEDVLRWMDLVLGGDLMDRFDAFQGFKRHAGLEFWAVGSAFICHRLGGLPHQTTRDS